MVGHASTTAYARDEMWTTADDLRRLEEADSAEVSALQLLIDHNALINTRPLRPFRRALNAPRTTTTKQ